MTNKEARDILIQFNEWRRDNNVTNSKTMPNPTEIGEAIDLAISYLDIARMVDEATKIQYKNGKI